MATEETTDTTRWSKFRNTLTSFIVEPKTHSRESSFSSLEDDVQEDPLVPDTCTGYRELPTQTWFSILLLWLPRFFIPWIAVWHEHDLLSLANPQELKSQEKILLNQKVILLCGKCGITLFVSFIAGVLDMERSAYVLLLLLYTLCPLAGAYVQSILRSRLIDNTIYTGWITSIALMRWTMAIPFIFFPVQLTSIFYEKENMSKQAHYNWIGFFFFFECLNDHAAFWLTPGCPTDWMQISVWVGITFALYTVFLLTVIFLFVARALMREAKDCWNFRNGGEEPNEMESSWSMVLKMSACYFCIFIPVIYASFVSNIVQGIPDDWNEQNLLSATGMYYIGRAIGVAFMIALLTTLRKYGTKITRIRIFRADVLVLGLPHIFNVIALLVLIHRLASLKLNEGDVIVGPTPNNKTVAVFFNLIFRNRTVCVTSKHFRPARIPPFHHASRQVPDADNIKFTVTPEPDSIPSVAGNYELKNFSRGDWVLFSITLNNLPPEFDAETKLKNYNSKPRVIRQWVNRTLSTKKPQVIIFNTHVTNAEAFTYHFRHDKTPENADVLIANAEGSAQLWEVLKPGNWSIRMESVVNDSNVAPWFRCSFDRSYSVFVLASYLHTIPPNELTLDLQLIKFELFQIAQIAGPIDRHLPPKEQLQRDAVIQTGMAFAGMAAGGVRVGVVYMFWIEPFIGTTMRFAILWVLVAVAEEALAIKLVDMDSAVSLGVGCMQIVFTILHFVGALFLYRPEFNDDQIRTD